MHERKVERQTKTHSGLWLLSFVFPGGGGGLLLVLFVFFFFCVCFWGDELGVLLVLFCACFWG